MFALLPSTRSISVPAQRTGWRRSHLVLALIVFQLSAILTYNYYSRVEEPFLDNRIALHNVIVSKTAPYQYRYRVLIPFTLDAIGRTLPNPAPAVSSDPLKALPYSKSTFSWLYACSNFFAFSIMLWSLGELVRRFFHFELALLGIALSAIVVDLTFRDHYFHPWSLWEGAYFAAGLLLIYRRKYWLLSILSALSVFNRETSIFLLVGFFFYALPYPFSIADLRPRVLLADRAMRFALANMAIWTGGYFILHAIVGYQPSTFSLQMAWEGNQQRWPYALLLNALLFGPAWILVARGLRRSPLLIRRFALMIPLYLALLLAIGYWWEIRYWITLLPILIPAFIAGLSRRAEAEDA